LSFFISRSLPQSQSPPVSASTTRTPAYQPPHPSPRSAGQQRLLLFEAGILHLFVQVKHLYHERDHAIVPDFVGGIGKVDGADDGPQSIFSMISDLFYEIKYFII